MRLNSYKNINTFVSILYDKIKQKIIIAGDLAYVSGYKKQK